MATLKKNISNITEDTETLVKDYLKLFSIKQSEKLALILGILSSVFILSTLLLIVILFCSFALAVYLNDILPGDYWGFWIISGFYVFIILLIIVRIIATKTPLFANIFVKFIVTLLNIDTEESLNIKGLRRDSENLNHHIETGKVKIKSNFELLRYALMESVVKEILGLFTSQKKDKDPDNPESGTPSRKKSKNQKN